jgi:putative transposase
MMSPCAVELKALAEKYPKYGCPTLHDMLRADGHVKNHKRTYRIYCEEGLQVRTKRRKKLYRPRVPMIVPDGPNQRWSVDFVSDQLANGSRFRVFNVVDDYSRELILRLSISRSAAPDWRESLTSWRAPTATPSVSSWTTARS